MPQSTLERILLIEDEPDIQMVARATLEAVGGFTVKICASGRAGVTEAAVFAPDIILLDVMMPEMDGLKTFAQLRQQKELDEVPIAFMTSKTSAPDIIRYQKLGAAGVIAKPFDPMELPQQVRKLWETRTQAELSARRHENSEEAVEFP